MSVMRKGMWAMVLVAGLGLAPVQNGVWGSAATDQERCQAEANWMAANGIRGHVGPNIGSFEGVGWGHQPGVATCQPGRPMQLTGDASAQGSGGMWYRVRSWR